MKTREEVKVGQTWSYNMSLFESKLYLILSVNAEDRTVELLDLETAQVYLDYDSDSFTVLSLPWEMIA